MAVNYPELECLPLAPKISAEQILRSMGGSPDRRVGRRLRRYLDEALPVVAEVARPKLAWRLFEREALAEIVPGSRRLQRYLAKSERCAVVAGAAGLEWQERIDGESDPFLAYLYSCAATALVRDTLESARRELSQRFPDARIGESISPGNDGLPLALQAAMNAFGLFAPLGIDFDADALVMTPLASVTAFIAFGSAVEKEAPIAACGAARPRCAECPCRSCALRVMPYEPSIPPHAISWSA